MTRKASTRGIALLAAIAILAFVPTALAAKGGGKGAPSTSDPGIHLVVLDSTDGVAHWGNHVTFDVSTTANQPYVTLNCYQSGVWVLSGSRGFYADYGPGQVFGLSWTGGGAADCTATLFTTSSSGRAAALAATSFHVEA